MVATCVFGAQWGDEGKGKVIDILAADAEFVVRYAGGNNAGHTVVIGEQRFALHLLPSGILRQGTRNILGSGVVVDPWHLVQEIAKLRATGIEVVLGKNLFLSMSAHLILPYHRQLDRVFEDLRGKGKIGTTGRGIGPAYMDRASRSGLRLGDLLDPPYLEDRIQAAISEKTFFLGPLDAKELCRELLELSRELKAGICDTGLLLRDALDRDVNVLFEGAQGLMLDVDLGTFPFVTSSSVAIGGVGGGAGVSPRAIDRVIAVAKAYTSRVGEGPFPTELKDERGAFLQKQGHEFGTVTGRPRRCGWFDAVAVRYAVRVTGADTVFLTKLDILSGLSQIKVAVAYEADGREYREFPAGLPGIERLGVRYQQLPGWDEDIGKVRDYDALPEAAKSYVAYLEELLGLPLSMLSVGPGRDQVIHKELA